MSESATPASDHAPQCNTDGCERTDLIKSAGICRRCYQLVRAGRDPAKPLRNRRHGELCTWPGGCGEKQRCRDLCQKHYDQERRGGKLRVRKVPKSPRAKGDRQARRVEFLWANIDQRGPDECWPWKRKPTDGGYGQLSWLRGQSAAHRAVYEVTYGSIPAFPGERTDIDHLCHDPRVCKLKTRCPHRLCCNPAHLKARPASENRRVGDMSRPGNGGGRSKCPPGCACNRHRSDTCAPGCNCGKHRSGSCPPGCTCGRHVSRVNGGRPARRRAA